MTLTPAIRDFLGELDEMIDAHTWPHLAREIVTVTPGRAAVLVRLPHRGDHGRDVELEVDDRTVDVKYGPEHVSFTSRAEGLAFVEMLGEGRVELRVNRGLLWATMESYRDGVSPPFRRTRMPWPSVRPRVERRTFGFAD